MIPKSKETKIDIGYYVFLIIATLGVGYISLGKGFDFNTFFSISGDGTFGVTLVKGIQENGFFGIWFNGRIGAPETSALIDYTGLGNVMVLLIWLISIFVKSTPAILYIYLILTFALDGVSMSLLLRKIGINREVSFVVSMLFACAPYHFYRYLVHASLINYMFVPIAIYLSLYIIGYIEEKTWKIILLCILLGLGYGYYYAFGLILMTVACIIQFIKIDKKKEIFKKLWVIGAVLATVLLTLTPKIVYALVNGANAEAGHRIFIEQEVFGLKIINLLLPVTYSRIEPLKALSDEYASVAPLVNENRFASLGIVGVVGFVALCVCFFISFIDRKRKRTQEWELIDFISLATLSFVLVGSVGGFGEIFNWAVTSQIRCYNRSSIVLTALSLMMIAILLNKIELKKKWISIVVCVLVLCIGLYDQVNIYAANWQDGIKVVQSMYEEYFDKVEESLPEGTMVYQLPYMDFPEAGSVNNVEDYKLFAGYLFTDNLKWSYGGVRGRNLAARNLNIDSGMSYTFLAKIKQAGFGAVYIDIAGYDDGGEQILSFYNSLGIEPIISGDNNLYVYDISKCEISEGYLKPGFAFIKYWTDTYSTDEVAEELLFQMTDGIKAMDLKTLNSLWMMCNNEDIVLSGTDEEYVLFLYREVLGREAVESELDEWVLDMQNGRTREDAFKSFLCCDEFRNGKGLAEE